jgi:betaine-aldehyde dehydrogenase
MTAVATARDELVRDALSALPPAGSLFIGGQWTEGASLMSTLDPTTEAPLTEVAKAGPEEVDRAVRGATTAQRDWARRSWQERAALLEDLVKAIEADTETLSVLEALDVGIPVTGMRTELANGIARLKYFAGLASEIKGESVQTADGSLNLSVRYPYPVVGRILPFNHPFQGAAGGIAGPLAAGCAVILKPSDHTPLSALRLARICEGVLPPGVVSVVTGDGATTGSAVVRHPGIPRIAFTGGVHTARTVLRDGAESIKTITLELGGKNPMIIFPDVDVASAVAACVSAMNFTRVQGQSCGSPSRVFVHEAVHDEFVSRLTETVSAMRVGDPLSPETAMGPLAYRAHRDKVERSIQTAVSQGAQLVTGGGRPAGLDTGYFLEATVFAGVEPHMHLAQEEVFGPVIGVLRWNDTETLVQQVNEVPYGLTANIWTRDVGAALRLVRDIDAGYIWVNGRGQRPTGVPFGGVKLSGIGRENDMSELLSYTQEKSVIIDASVAS